MEMVKLKAPTGATGISFGTPSIEYSVENGFVTVPAAAVAAAIGSHGYSMPGASIIDETPERDINPDAMTRKEMFTFLADIGASVAQPISIDALRAVVKSRIATPPAAPASAPEPAPLLTLMADSTDPATADPTAVLKA